MTSASDASTAGKKAAIERLVVNHWDEYQKLVQDSVDAVMAEQLAKLPEDIRELVRAAANNGEQVQS